MRLLYQTMLFILSLFEQLINRMLFLAYKVKYGQFPAISGLISLSIHGKFELGSNVKITSKFSTNPVGLAQKCAFYVGNGATIYIGNNVGISNSLLYARTSIRIEDDVMIGGGCQILDSDFHSISYTERIKDGDKNVKSYPVCIKKGVFIGTNSIILKGVTIGERSVVSAGSIVTQSIPSDEIWGGNPAIFIKKII